MATGTKLNQFSTLEELRRIDLSTLRSGRDKYSSMDTEQMAETFEGDTRRARATQLRWASRVRDAIPGLRPEEYLNWGEAISKAIDGGFAHATEYYQIKPQATELEEYVVSAAMLHVINRVYEKAAYSYQVLCDPVVMRFSPGQTPVHVKRLAAGSSEAAFELCEMAIERSQSFRMLEERTALCVKAAERTRLNVKAIKEIASERYRAIEREEF